MSAELAVTFFILIIPAILFVLPFIVENNNKRFNENEIIHLIIKRSLWILALWFMSLNSGIMLTIANNASMGVDDELIRYLWFFGWSGILLMVFMAYRMLVDAVTLKMIKNKEKRFG